MSKIARKQHQLTVKIDEEIFTEVKVSAAKSGIKIKQWVQQAFVQQILREKKAQ